MTQTELIDQLAHASGLQKKQAKAFLDSFAEIIEKSEYTAIKGFGTFKKVIVPARTARNPRTGEPLQIPEKVKLTFKASKKS